LVGKATKKNKKNPGLEKPLGPPLALIGGTMVPILGHQQSQEAICSWRCFQDLSHFTLFETPPHNMSGKRIFAPNLWLSPNAHITCNPIYGSLQMGTSLATQSMALSKCAHHLQPNHRSIPFGALIIHYYECMPKNYTLCLLVNDSVISSYQKNKKKGKKTITWKIHWENMAHFTLGVRANVQPKSSIPIGAKVEISPKG
jgi:hypothetical protein